MISLRRYIPSDKVSWDKFVEDSKNGTFLHKRDYMEYHSDRFADYSLMAFRDGRLYALLPACSQGHDFVSHAGLTFGGLIMNRKATASDILTLFSSLSVFLKERGFSRMVYSPTPHIYHSLPSEEDLYALFRQGATLSTRKIASAIELSNTLRWRDIRRAGIRKALKEDLYVVQTDDFSQFWKILEENLRNKYDAAPVHSLQEISRLNSIFPDNIRLYVVKKGEREIAGVVMYVSRLVAHCQYISADKVGKEAGALDLLFNQLLTHDFKDYKYFDFGTSNEDGGRYLNESLIYQKEGFGARAICYDTYSLSL